MENTQQIHTSLCTVKRLKEILATIKDDGKVVCGIKGTDFSTELVAHIDPHMVVLEFR